MHYKFDKNIASFGKLSIPPKLSHPFRDREPFFPNDHSALRATFPPIAIFIFFRHMHLLCLLCMIFLQTPSAKESVCKEVFFMQNSKSILLEFSSGNSQRGISKKLGVSRNSVSTTLKAFHSSGCSLEHLLSLSNDEIQELLFPDEIGRDYLQPDYESINQELCKPGMTLGFLFERYVSSCRAAGQKHCQKSAFYENYSRYISTNNVTKHLIHKPGREMMVDWDGKTLKVDDLAAGRTVKAYLFIATLPYSMMSFVKAYPDMKQNSFLDGHIKAYEYFGGVTPVLVPDNLKTSVIENKKYNEPILNHSYEEMADYYGASIVPARVRKPQDKAAVEGSVRQITQWIFPWLDGMRFFSFEELNKAIFRLIDQFNELQFQKRIGSRRSVLRKKKRNGSSLSLLSLLSWRHGKPQ